MSCSIVQASTIPIRESKIPSPPTSFPPILQPGFRHSRSLLRANKISLRLIVNASSALVDTDSVSMLERCFTASPTSLVPDSLPSSSYTSSSWVPPSCGPATKKQYGAHGAVTLERPKVEWSQKQSQSSPEISTGGGGGDIGKRISHGGGGDGGDGGGDDDDYADFDDDGEEGDDGWLFRRRIILQELFDRKFVDAVLNEWQKTMMDLPAGFRQAYEMGLLSSAQMVRFLSVHARPTTARFIARALSQGVSRAFVGRMIADPAFLYRLLLEEVSTVCFSVWSELKARKDRIRNEWPMALANVLTASACSAIVVWSLAPCRSYGNTFRSDLQNTLQKLPNNVFEKSYPLREFDLAKRVQSFFYKAAQLCMAGMVTGSLQGVSSRLITRKKEDRLSKIIPTVGANALGCGAFLGLYGNLRYQLLCGIDRALVDHFDVIGVALGFSTVLRILNVQLGETTRQAWLGAEFHPLLASDNHTSTSSTTESAKGFVSIDTILSGLNIFGAKHEGTANSAQASHSKTRRKRTVRRKMTANLA